MVSGIIGEIYCRIIFYLSNGTNFTFNTSDAINNNNFLTSIKIEEKTSENNNVPIGVNSSSVLDIEGVSNNHALIPDNEDSVYYGYMNNTCFIDVYITEVATLTETYMGRFYVDSWKSNITNSTPNMFVISATGIMGNIGKLNVPDVAIGSTFKTKDFVMEVINNINNDLPSEKQITVNSANIDFDEYPDIYYCNLNTDSISDCFNEISQGTLTNIYVDRNRNLKTDYCLDDTEQDADYEIDVILSSEIGNGSLVNYDGVKLNYSLGDIKNIESLASVSEYSISPEENIIKDIDLGDGVYKICRIEVTPDISDVTVEIANLTYTKDKLSIELSVDTQVKVNVTIYGQRLDSTLLNKEIGGDNKLEITNKIITADFSDKYLDGLNKLISIKNNSMQIEAYINPAINISDIIYVNAIGAMSVSGYYKVISLSWDIGQYCKCIVGLMKTFDDDTMTEEEISTNLQTQLAVLHESATSNSNVNPSQIIDISEQANDTYMENGDVYNSTYELYSVI